MKRMIFCIFMLAAAVASGGIYSGLKDKCLDWPGWIDENLIPQTEELGESDLPMGQHLAIALLGGAEYAAATQYAQHGKRPSSGWRLSDSAKDFSTMPRALDAQGGARTKRLIDIAYSVATNGANVTRGGAVYSPLFTEQTGNVRISGDTWRIDDGKQFSASKFAVGPGCGNIMSDSVSHDWANKFSVMISAAGGSPDDSGITAELESRRDAFRESMRESTVYPFATFKSESSVAVGHGRLPSARDVRWSNWLARQFNTMFVDLPESAITFDVEEMTATNSISIAGSEIRSRIIALINSGPGDGWAEIVGGEIKDGGGAFYRGTNETSPVPVSEWTAYFMSGDAVASGEAIYHVDSRTKQNDTGWVFWFSREEADGGRYDYYRRSWRTHIEIHFQNATATANTYTAKRVNNWRRAVSWNFANTFPNWYDDAESRFLSAVDSLTIWAGYRIHRERTDKNGTDYEEDHGNIVYSDGTDPDMKNAVGDALFQVAYDAYMGDHENDADFDDFRLHIHTYFDEPTKDREEGRVKVVYTPSPDDPMGQPKTSYYDDDHHGDPNPPRPENTDDDGVPAGQPTTGDPDDPSGGSGPGDSDSIRVPVRVDVNSGGMEYTRRDIRTWSGFNLLGRYKFNFIR